MKLLLIIISLILGAGSFGQVPKNEQALDSWDSLFARHNQALEFYNERLASELFKSDTLTTKDSIVVTMFTKASLLLQRVVNYLDSAGCVDHTKNEYYNSRGLISYVRRYTQSCPLQISAQDEDIVFHVVYYERFEYDENDNLVIRVYNISTPMTIKETYVNENGHWTKKRQRINETDFWK